MSHLIPYESTNGKEVGPGSSAFTRLLFKMYTLLVKLVVAVVLVLMTPRGQKIRDRRLIFVSTPGKV